MREDYESNTDVIFSEYACFSSYSDSYVEMATERFGLDGDSRVIEVAAPPPPMLVST